MHFQVRHLIPGRVRIYLPLLKSDADTAERLVSFVGRQQAVIHARANTLCGSLVIEHTGDIAPLLDRIARLNVPELRVLLAATINGIQRSSDPPADKALADGSKANPRTLLFATASLLLSKLPFHSLSAILNIPLVIWNALPIWKRAIAVLVRERRLNVDFLDGLATMIALLQGHIFTAAFIVWLISLGDWIRDLTAANSKRVMTDLLEYQGRNAWVLRNGQAIRVPVKEIATGETVLVYAGELIPVDGNVEGGKAAVDQKMVTGESTPVLRAQGDRVYAGTAIRDGKLRVVASRVGSQTSAAQIVSMIESAPVTETRVQNYAEKFADRLVAPWLALSLGVFGATRNAERLLSMMIIDYGTGIRVAAPTSILACMTAAARQGILIKGGSQMEKLARADTLIFDKTGTLTRGNPHVVHVLSYRERHFPTTKILEIAAALEARITHPFAEAIVNKARQSNLIIPERSHSKYSLGMGVQARVNGYYVHLGSRRFLRQNGIDVEAARRDVNGLNQRGCSTVVMAIDGELVGAVACADEIRRESRDVIRSLHNSGIKEVMIVTGDTTATARAVSGELGIDRVFAETMPDEKAAIVQRLQREGRTVVMVGDGVNDSPALAYADVGIAMKNGADVAHASADVVLMEDNLWKLPAAVEFSHKAMALVRQNYAIIVALNTLAVALALPTGAASAGAIAALSNGSAILASLNAIRPLLTGY